MAGMISLGGNDRWLVSGWLFYWVVGFLAVNVEQQQLATDIDHVRAAESGLLELEVFGPAADQEMRGLIRNGLVAAAEQRFPLAMEGREAALGLLQELAQLA
jgi:hypothetical protein